MRPAALELEGFGPYRKREYIDFGSLGANGLFLICGETGSGKTMLLDAMSFALFGRSTGNNRDDITALRSNRCGFGDTTFVSFTFEQVGSIYRFERRLERKRKNLSQSAAAFKMNEDGVFEPLFENAREREVNQKAEEIIGFKYDQFRQVIVLPQGQFEKFLTSNSDEKEAILSNIFGVGKWQQLAKRFYDAASMKCDKLAGRKRETETLLAAEGCADISELKQRIAEHQGRLKEFEAEYKSVNYDGRRMRIEAARKTMALFEELDRHQDELNRLIAGKALINAKEKRRDEGKQAERIEPLILREKRAGENVLMRRKAADRAAEELEAAAAKLKSAVDMLNGHIGKKEEIEVCRRNKSIYESRRERYASIDSLRQEAENKRKEKTAAGEKTRTAGLKKDKAEAALVASRKAYEAAKELHTGLLDSYFAGIYGEAAKNLKDGRPCPVCGSTEHPHKAAFSEHAVSRKDTEAAKKREDECYGAMNDADTAASNAKSVYDDSLKAESAAEAEYRLAAERLAQAEQDRIAGIDDGKALEAVIAGLGRQIREYETEEQRLEGLKAETDKKLEGSRIGNDNSLKELEAAEKELKEATEELKSGLGDTDFKNQSEAEAALPKKGELDKLSDEISEYYANIESRKKLISEKQKETGDSVRPDRQFLEAEEKELEAKKTEYIKQRTSEEGTVARLSRLSDNISEITAGLEQELAQAESDLLFAKKLRGDTGIGLHRYVLGIMFGSVISSANRMLENVHGGRYRLCRSDEGTAGSRKKGLDLKVYDSFSENGEARDVATLSGGEKFLVSLSLSIGVSAAAAGSGARIDAMFIDEGFGTLDDSSINDALEIIGSIRRSNGMVGIISHVQVLRDNIPDKLLVHKSREGSSISVIRG